METYPYYSQITIIVSFINVYHVVECVATFLAVSIKNFKKPLYCK